MRIIDQTYDYNACGTFVCKFLTLQIEDKDRYTEDESCDYNIIILLNLCLEVLLQVDRKKNNHILVSCTSKHQIYFTNIYLYFWLHIIPFYLTATNMFSNIIEVLFLEKSNIHFFSQKYSSF